MKQPNDVPEKLAPPQSKWMRRAAIATTATMLGVIIGGVTVYRSVRWTPEFYVEKLAVDTDVLTQNGQQMESEVQTLNQELNNRGNWEATFSEEEINGWLAVDLKKRFPRMLPHQIRDPRVSFSPGLAQVACQYISSELQVILSLDVDVSLTGTPNEIAVRIKKARIGAVPGLMQMAKQSISNAALRAKIPLRWIENEGDPVALVTVPTAIIRNGRQIHIDELRVEDGEIRLVGRSEATRQPQQVAMR